MKGGGVVVFNATFSNISVLSWLSFLLLEETGIPGENHRPVASHWQTLSHNVVSSKPRLSRQVMGFMLHGFSFLSSVVFCRSLFVLFLLAIVLSVLRRLADSDCPFSSIKLFNNSTNINKTNNY